MVITTAISIYGLKMSSAIWRAKLAEKFIFLGYKSSKADSDVWIKWDFKPNGYPYYKYILLFVYDLLHICFNPKEDINALNMIYWLMKGFISPDL